MPDVNAQSGHDLLVILQEARLLNLRASKSSPANVLGFMGFHVDGSVLEMESGWRCWAYKTSVKAFSAVVEFGLVIPVLLGAKL